jgi:hypothetical protein
MNEETARNPFRSGLWLCWISLFVLPVGLLAIGGGPCAGPRNALGSLILLGVGGCAAGAAIYGVVRVLRGIKAKAISMRLWGVLSVACAGFAAFVGGVYLLLGFVSLETYLRY